MSEDTNKLAMATDSQYSEIIPNPSKLIVDADPKYLEMMRALHAKMIAEDKLSGDLQEDYQDDTVFALYGPQAEVPNGVGHFQTVKVIVDYVQANTIKAVLSGVEMPQAPEGHRRYGFRLSGELEQYGIEPILHSSNSKKYEIRPGDNFYGIRPKNELPEVTLQILNGVALRASERLPITKVSGPKLQEKLLVNILTVNCNIPKDTKPALGRHRYDINACEDVVAGDEPWYNSAIEIADYTKTTRPPNHGVVIGTDWEAPEKAVALAAALKKEGCSCPVTVLVRGLSDELGKAQAFDLRMGGLATETNGRVGAHTRIQEAKFAKLEEQGKEAGFRVGRFSEVDKELSRVAQRATGLPVSAAFL